LPDGVRGAPVLSGRCAPQPVGGLKKTGLVNRHLSGALAELGHGDGATELVLGGATAARKVREANPEASALLDDHLPWPDMFL
jgi:D-ribose pyranase